MSFFKKRDKPAFFGGLLGNITRAISPLAGTALGGYLGSLTTNPYAIAGGGATGQYIGQKGGDALASAFEQYMPFKQGGRVYSSSNIKSQGDY